LPDLFDLFEWYDVPVILFFSNLLSVLLLATVFGGGLLSGALLLATWEGWKFYERFRARNT